MTRQRKIVEKFRQAAKSLGRDSGSALVEMAISTTLIMSVFLGVFQLAMACYTYNTICEVARESARWAAVRGSTCNTNTPNLDRCSSSTGATSSDIQNYAKTVGAIDWSQCTSQSPCVSTSWMTGTTVTGQTQTTTTWSACSSGTCNKPGNLVIVNITYPYRLNLPFLRSYSMSLKATSQMVVAQ